MYLYLDFSGKVPDTYVLYNYKVYLSLDLSQKIPIQGVPLFVLFPKGT